jgi:hypothetical protein
MIRTFGLAAVAMLAVTACGAKEETPAAATTAVTEAQSEQAAAIAALGALSSGGQTNPQMKAYTANFVKVADAFSTVTDEASAKAAAEKLAPIFAEMETQSAALEKMTEAEQMQAAMAAMPELLAAQVKISTAMQTWSTKPELMEILSKELEKIPEVDSN